MAQITAGDGTIDPTVVDGTDLAARLERFYAADQSQNSGPSRPATLTAGGLWVKTGAANSPELYMYDGATDILIMDKNGLSGGDIMSAPPAGTSQTITAAAPSDTILTLNPAAGQTANRLTIGSDLYFGSNGDLWRLSGDATRVTSVIWGEKGVGNYGAFSYIPSAMPDQSFGSSGDFSVRGGIGGLSLAASVANTPIKFWGNGTERARITSTGEVFINTPTALGGSTAKLQVNGDAYASGTVFGNGAALTSDRRLKSNVADEPVNLDALAALKPKRYTMDGVEQVGLIAQDLEAVAPHCVITTPLTQMYDASVDYSEGDTVVHQKKIYEALGDVKTGIQPDDVWTPAVDAVDAVDAVFDDDGNEVTPAKDAIPAKGGWKPVGDAPLATDGSVMTEQKAISVGPLQAMLMGAVTELIAENKALKAQISAIEARLTALEAN